MLGADLVPITGFISIQINYVIDWLEEFLYAIPIIRDL